MAGVCRPGDVLGLLGGDIGEILPAHDVRPRAQAVADRRPRRRRPAAGPGGELVTLVTAPTPSLDWRQRLADHLGLTHPEVDVAILDGGQPLYLLLVGVE